MKYVVSKSTTKEEFDAILDKIQKKRQINLEKYHGILKNKIDGLEYQDKIRGDWK